jgi:chromosome segregation ATPase
LCRRQGILDTEVENMKVTLDPILLRLKRDSAQMEERKQKLSLDIEQMEMAIAQLEQTIDRESSIYAAKSTQLQSQEDAWQQFQQELDGIQAKVKVYEEILQPLQDAADRVRTHLEGLGSLQARLNDSGASPQEAIADLQQMVAAWANTPEMATA